MVFGDCNPIELGSYKCDSCSLYFNQLRDLNAHWSRRKPGFKVACKKCEMEFCTFQELFAHREKREQLPERVAIKCPECPNTYNNESSFKFHVARHKRTCSYCKQHFPNLTELQNHIERRKSQICERCDKIFCNNKRYHSHLTSHIRKDKEFKCSICNKVFASKLKLTPHLKKHNLCGVCGKQFVSKWHLEEHNFSIDSGGPFKCGKCLKLFCIKNDLQNHIKDHNEGTITAKIKVESLTIEEEHQNLREELIKIKEEPIKIEEERYYEQEQSKLESFIKTEPEEIVNNALLNIEMPKTFNVNEIKCEPINEDD